MARQSTNEDGGTNEVASAPSAEPGTVSSGPILVRTRHGHEFIPNDVSGVERITSTGVRVSREKADKIIEQATLAGGPGYVTEVEVTDDDA